MGGATQARLSGHTCLVTGANSGIGREIALGLARQGARVVMACRNQGRGEAAREQIANTSGNDAIELRLVDLSSGASIRDLATRLRGELDALHVLVNNAGVWSQKRRASPDGIESTWATNQLGYYLLTHELLDLVRAAPPARIVNVASQFAGELDLRDVQFERRGYAGPTAYKQSKQANRMWTWALARRLEGSGVTANAMHPGGVRTSLFRKAGGLLGPAIALWALAAGRSPGEGADTAVWLATDPDLATTSGRFWIDRTDVRCRFKDPDQEEALWQLCAEMTRT